MITFRYVKVYWKWFSLYMWLSEGKFFFNNSDLHYVSIGQCWSECCCCCTDSALPSLILLLVPEFSNTALFSVIRQWSILRWDIYSVYSVWKAFPSLDKDGSFSSFRFELNISCSEMSPLNSPSKWLSYHFYSHSIPVILCITFVTCW